jgi:hypothetical protein
LQWLPNIDVEGHNVADEPAVVVPDSPAELVEADATE